MDWLQIYTFQASFEALCTTVKRCFEEEKSCWDRDKKDPLVKIRVIQQQLMSLSIWCDNFEKDKFQVYILLGNWQKWQVWTCHTR